ncbi:MAG: AraC family transcriptional regulator [Mesorhizobium sp.]|uniref:helix-turn-helix domain-containing protein n=1 Tax=Mesorhizobium sp. TaxID=1871066 RepID=UPI001AC32F1B|nr:helix-turn-helix domain-containing protein [Mesorhizobium sp.]MBN9220668.1 AraC family transcriptional regulator [Mesorhizobium sp.]
METRTKTVLAGCVGRYAEAAPVPALREHFLCAWKHSIPDDHAGRIAVVPDGCVDLLWHDGRLVVVGPDITAANPDLRPGVTVLGMRFRPGAAARWLGLPMTEIVGSEIDMRDIWGARASDIAGRLQDEPGLFRQAGLLQQLLARMAPSVEEPSRDGAAIFALLQHDGVPEGEGMSRLVSRLDLSERTLRRRSRDLFGYGPKTLERILRFQRFQALARRSPDAGLADMAYATGYADQAHLSREIQTLSGMTARAFVRQLAH